MIKELPQNHFDSVVRNVMTTDIDRLKQLSGILKGTLRRLGKRPKPAWAHTARVPVGSDHFDNGSLKDWVDKIQIGDDKAMRQVAILEATVQARLSGG